MRVMIALLVCCGPILGQYPPGQYPPGTYPPGTYPGQYPPNTYPTRLPGGIPVDLPVPEVKLPKKQPKEQGETKTTMASVDGALRKLGEKELFLQPSAKTILRFRLLVKTQFHNKAGEPIRDSLLHPGDQLSVQVSPDDEETALRVTLLRNGTDAERKAAELPFDESAARAPKPEDLGKPKTVTSKTSAPADAEPAAAAEPPKSESAASPPADEAPPARTGAPLSDEQLIVEARAASSRFTAGLPNFLADQSTKRYFSSGLPASWQLIDEVGAEVAYVDGKEDYRKITVDGQPTPLPPQKTGSWSTGEFGTTLEDLMSPQTQASFHRRAEDRIGSRTAVVFDFQVTQANSHWAIVAPDERDFKPPFEGSIWVDKETARVLRLEEHTTFMPADFPFTKAEATLEFAWARIDQKSYLMPSSAENLACMRGSRTCSKNTIAFKNYRKFTADSKLTW